MLLAKNGLYEYVRTLHVKSGIFIFGCLFLLATSIAYGHGISHDRINQITLEIKKQPKNSALFIKRGRVYLDSQHWQDAERDFNQAHQFNTNNTDALYWLAVTCYKQRDINEQFIRRAHDYVRRYLQRQPRSPLGQRLLANILVFKQDFAQAEIHFLRALEYDQQPAPHIHIERLGALASNASLSGDQMFLVFSQTIKQYGELIAVFEAYYDYFLARKYYSHGLAVITSMPPAWQKIPMWQWRKVELLMLNNQQDLAVIQFNQLEQTIANLPQSKRHSGDVKRIIQSMNSIRGTLYQSP